MSINYSPVNAFYGFIGINNEIDLINFNNISTLADLTNE